MKRTRAILVAAVVCVLAIDPAAVRAQEAERSFAMGMTYWPSSDALASGEALRRDVGALLRNSEVVHVQFPWCPGEEPTDPDWMSSVAREAGKELAISVDWLADSRDRVRCSGDTTWSFGDSSVSGAFERAMARLAYRHRPDYLVLGVEVDYYAGVDPRGFRGFLTAYSRTRSRIEQFAPNTRIGVSFQYEHATSTTGSSTSLLGDMVDAFAGMSDFVGLSVYPFKAGKDPGEVDADYFEPVSDLALPLVMTETAWPGEAAVQARYLERILQAADDLDMRLLFWTSTTDVEASVLGPGVPTWADRLGLWDRSRVPKPGLDVWRSWLEMSRASSSRP